MSKTASENVFTLGSLRISILGPTLVRLEERGRHGFEDRKTFLIEDRSPRPATCKLSEDDHVSRIVLDRHVIVVPRGAPSIRELVILDHHGVLVWRLDDAPPARPAWPDPVHPGRCWAVADSPRIVRVRPGDLTPLAAAEKSPLVLYAVELQGRSAWIPDLDEVERQVLGLGRQG